ESARPAVASVVTWIRHAPSAAPKVNRLGIRRVFTSITAASTATRSASWDAIGRATDTAALRARAGGGRLPQVLIPCVPARIGCADGGLQRWSHCCSKGAEQRHQQGIFDKILAAPVVDE